jgi:site-specific recombinase XerD
VTDPLPSLSFDFTKMNKVVKLPARYRRRKVTLGLTGAATHAVLYLTKEEVQRLLLNAIPRAATRDALLFDLMYHYGLRREEATLIRREHVGDRIWITRVKRGESCEYPIFARTRRLLRSHLSTSLIYQEFRRYADAAGLPLNRQHPHVLRHSIAVHLMNAGWDLADVQKWLGHASIASTLVYAKVSNARLDKKFRALRSTEVAAL